MAMADESGTIADALLELGSPDPRGFEGKLSAARKGMAHLEAEEARGQTQPELAALKARKAAAAEEIERLDEQVRKANILPVCHLLQGLVDKVNDEDRMTLNKRIEGLRSMVMEVDQIMLEIKKYKGRGDQDAVLRLQLLLKKKEAETGDLFAVDDVGEIDKELEKDRKIAKENSKKPWGVDGSARLVEVIRDEEDAAAEFSQPGLTKPEETFILQRLADLTAEKELILDRLWLPEDIEADSRLEKEYKQQRRAAAEKKAVQMRHTEIETLVDDISKKIKLFLR